MTHSFIHRFSKTRIGGILTSPKTTLALGATLGALLTGGALAPALSRTAIRGAPGFLGRGIKSIGRFVRPKTVKGAIGLAVGLPTAIGILSQSKKARGIVRSALDPRESIKRGKKLGEIIEDPSKAQDILGVTKEMTLAEKIKQGAKTAGKFGAIIAGVGALGLGARKAKQLLDERRARKVIDEQEEAQRLVGLKQVGFTEPRPVGLGGVPVGIPGQLPGSPLVNGSSRAVGAPISKPPIQNIIQIQVR